jgi:major vault protein
MASVIRIKPYHYIHVLDNNANTTRVEVGPQTFTSQVTCYYHLSCCVLYSTLFLLCVAE